MIVDVVPRVQETGKVAKLVMVLLDHDEAMEIANSGAVSDDAGIVLRAAAEATLDRPE